MTVYMSVAEAVKKWKERISKKGKQKKGAATCCDASAKGYEVCCGLKHDRCSTIELLNHVTCPGSGSCGLLFPRPSIQAKLSRIFFFSLTSR